MPRANRRTLGHLTLAVWGIGLLGCAPRALVTPASTVPMPVGTVRLVLGEGRSVQWVAPASRARITVDGPGMTEPAVLTADLSSEATASVTISSLIAGPHRIVTLERLDATGAGVPGGTIKTTVDVPAEGRADAVIGRSTTPRGAIFEAVLASDRAHATHLAETLDAAAVQALVEQVIRQEADYADLVDAAAIATDVVAGQRVPAFETRYVRYPAALDLTLEGLPGTAPADVWLDDPLSPKNVSLYNGTHRLSPVAPGTWVLHAQSAAMGVEATRSITLVGNQHATASINLGAPADQIRAALPSAGMASAFGVLTLGGSDGLWMVGGLKRATDSIYYHNEVWAYDGSSWTQKGYAPVAGGFAQAATLAGELYVAGGLRPGGAGLEPTTDVVRFDGSRWARVTDLPQSRGSAAVAALGGKLYVVGGFKHASWGPYGTYPDTYDPKRDFSIEFNATESFRYDPATQAWSAMPTGLSIGRGDVASAVCNGRMYVFGGQQFTDYAGSYMELARDTVESTDESGIWRREASMPTARGGAAAVVANGKIYVIGGCTLGGIPLNSVEVFDPGTGRWSIKAPLRRARGYVTAAFLNGRIVVAGGGDGGSAGLEGLPQDTVESFVP